MTAYQEIYAYQNAKGRNKHVLRPLRYLKIMPLTGYYLFLKNFCEFLQFENNSTVMRRMDVIIHDIDLSS
jgi:hypothetical protein